MKIIIAAFFDMIYCNETVLRCSKKGIKIDGIVFIGNTRRELSEKLMAERCPDLTGLRIVDLERLHIPCYFVKNLNKDPALSLLRELEPDVILQGGGPIYRPPLIEIPRIGILNSHPGILPGYQGCTAVEWSIYYDDPVGSTCHFIDEGIDTGPIITSSTFPVYKDDSYQDVRTRSFHHEIDTLIEGLTMVMNGFRISDATPQVNGTYHKVADREVMAEIYQKLKKGRYRYARERPASPECKCI